MELHVFRVSEQRSADRFGVLGLLLIVFRPLLVDVDERRLLQTEDLVHPFASPNLGDMRGLGIAQDAPVVFQRVPLQADGADAVLLADFLSHPGKVTLNRPGAAAVFP